jgi:hypothetical protein
MALWGTPLRTLLNNVYDSALHYINVNVSGIVGANIAQETGGNLDTISVDTTTLVTPGGGGYVRQDSTGTIAKETGGNLATIAGDTTSLDTKQPALGTAVMAASIPVTLSSDDTLTAAANAILTTIDVDTDAISTNTGIMGTGFLPFFDSDGDNTVLVVKAAAGRLYKIEAVNSNGVDVYIQLFDVAAGSVTVGVTTPNYVIYVPTNGAVFEDFAMGLAFSTAISYACTTTATGAGDPTTGLTISGGYI